MNKSTVLATRAGRTSGSASRSRTIADVNPIGPNNILLTAKKPGATQLIVWDDADRSQMVDVAVDDRPPGAPGAVQADVPRTARSRSSMANGQIALRGQVPNLQVAEQADGARAAVRAEGAELPRDRRRAAGDAPGALRGGLPLGDERSSASTSRHRRRTSLRQQHRARRPTRHRRRSAGGAAGRTAINPARHAVRRRRRSATPRSRYFVAALRQNNLLRILAEPNLDRHQRPGGELPGRRRVPDPGPAGRRHRRRARRSPSSTASSASS